MAERILFLTGHLAEPRLRKIVAGLRNPPFTPVVHNIGVKVAALMTGEIIARRLPRPVEADRVVTPGRCRADLEALSRDFGVPFVRGPDELADLAAWLGQGGRKPDLSRYDMRIFAEIVDASQTPVDALLTRARAMRAAGADVVDLGCLPDTPFPHMEDAIAALRAESFQVSVDSADPRELERAVKAGAHFLLSLNVDTLSIAQGAPVTPILTPKPHGDLDSLVAAATEAQRRGIDAILDPILDPIHFGFAASLARYTALRERLPDAEIMMGTGNLTELTEADSAGVTAMLLGVCSELGIRNLLTVQVSPHTRRTIEEHDAARRLMFAARQDEALPKGYGAGLLQLHDAKPFPASAADVAALASEIRDRNYRIAVAEDGVHVFSSAMHAVAENALDLFPALDVAGDGAHAFYLGAEMMKAEIAFLLGKRYAQDESLDWGVGAPKAVDDSTRLKEAGHTLRATNRGAREGDV
ncbi:MAG: dihydropteroate synthase [Hyphomicrobiales bacterium]|nr:dihydropteroate synthase [Hyphomicrobiales bacterium]